MGVTANSGILAVSATTTPPPSAVLRAAALFRLASSDGLIDATSFTMAGTVSGGQVPSRTVVPIFGKARILGSDG